MSEMVWHFDVAIPADLPTPNLRLHWAERARRVKNVRAAVALQAKSVRNGWRAPTGKRSLTLVLVRGKGQRLLDADNAVACLKPVIDGLVDAGWLVDDNGKSLGETVVIQERGPKPAVKVTVYGPAGLEETA